MFEYDLCIIGGTTDKGICWGLSFVQAGLSVVVYSELSDAESFCKIKSGVMPYQEPYAQVMLTSVLNKKLFMSSDKSVMSQSRFIMIADEQLGNYDTPHSKHLWQSLLTQRAFHEDSSQIIIVETPLFKGVTALLKKYEIQRVVCCVTEVHKNSMIENMHQNQMAIASDDGQEVLKEVKALFARLTDEVVRVSVAQAESSMSVCVRLPHKESQVV